MKTRKRHSQVEVGVVYNWNSWKIRYFDCDCEILTVESQSSERFQKISLITNRWLRSVEKVTVQCAIQEKKEKDRAKNKANICRNRAPAVVKKANGGFKKIELGNKTFHIKKIFKNNWCNFSFTENSSMKNIIWRTPHPLNSLWWINLKEHRRINYEIKLLWNLCNYFSIK